MKRLVLMLVIFLALPLIGMSDAINEDVEMGISLAKKGDYDSAIKWVEPLAEHGNEAAQYVLGYAFAGKGDYDSAIKWLQPLAEQGDENAQIELGISLVRKGDNDSAAG